MFIIIIMFLCDFVLVFVSCSFEFAFCRLYFCFDGFFVVFSCCSLFVYCLFLRWINRVNLIGIYSLFYLTTIMFLCGRFISGFWDIQNTLYLNWISLYIICLMMWKNKFNVLFVYWFNFNGAGVIFF